MFQLLPIVFVSVLGLIAPSTAQYPPPVTYDTVLTSPIDPSITISYKSPSPGTCLTAFPNQKQYSGYVNLPPSTLQPYQQDYSINTFFWFFEARNSPETAPLTIWLNGGPGSSSMIGLFRESGPCEVVQLQDGSYGTQPNTWGWDRSSNVLFIDQPTQTGFSYDAAVNMSMNLLSGDRSSPRSAPGSLPPWAFLNGTFPSGRSYNTQNTSVIAASASWHFLQGFLAAFPQYNPGTHPNRTTVEPTGIHLFAESYGGQYGPAFAHFFEEQNAKRLSGSLPLNDTLEIKLASVGIVNGLVDELIQAPYWPKFAYNNTYGIEAIDLTTELNALSGFSGPNGCGTLVDSCRKSMEAHDPNAEGDEAGTNRLCSQATETCRRLLDTALQGDFSAYDIRSGNINSFPSYAYLEYLNNGDVLQSVGAKINYTESSADVFDGFARTGDEVRGTQIQYLADLLSSGVHVALLYGDADIICNWYGGEAVSLKLASLLPTYSSNFPAAGYADIITNSTYTGGQVRQYGNLSFSRIYDAGHTIPSYQPETAFTVFTRIIQSKDIGTGDRMDSSTFSTKGPATSDHTNKAPARAKNVCWVRAIDSTCTREETNQIANGQGVVKNGVWYAHERDYAPPSSYVSAGKPGTPTVAPTSGKNSPTTTASIALTGVYTATGTPKAKSGAVSFRLRARRDGTDRRGLFDGLLGKGRKEAGDLGRLRRLKWIVPLAAAAGAFIAGLAAAASACGIRACIAKKKKRHFFGGPKQRILAPPIQRVAVDEAPKTAPPDVEKQETLEGPPLVALERRVSRPTTAPMEPIPENEAPKLAPNASPQSRIDDTEIPHHRPSSPHRLSTRPSEQTTKLEEPQPRRRSEPIVLQRIATSLSRQPTEHVPPSRTSAKPTTVSSSRPSTPPPEVKPLRRATTVAPPPP